jgi:uncharacterized delta-60 repeat protein
MKINLLNKILILFFILPLAINAQNSGDLDPGFADDGLFIYDNGFNDLFTCVAIQDDQKIVAGGMSYDPTYTATATVFRFLTDGSIDTDFATNGIFSYSLDNEANIFGCSIRENGKIVLAGSTTDYTDSKILLLQLNSDGTLDDSFGDDGVVVQKISLLNGSFEDYGLALTLQDDGMILVAGRSLDINANFEPAIVRFTENGVIDPDFGTNGVARLSVEEIDNDFDCIVLQEDGKIVVSGHYQLGLSYFGMLVARYNSDGTLDDSFADDGVFIDTFSNIDDEGFGVAINSEGKILVSGFTVTEDYDYSMLLMQLTTTGELDMDFGSGGIVISNLGVYDVGSSISIQSDDKILVAGSSGELPPAGDSEMAVWRYNPDGTLDDSFGDEGISLIQFENSYDEATSMAIQSNGNIVIAGKSRNNGMQDIDFAMARLLNNVEELEAAFTATPNPVCVGESVDFTDTSIGNIIGYEWTFEGGTPSSSTEQNPQVTYDVAGSYDVQLIVTNADLEEDTLLMENYLVVLSTPEQLETPSGETEVCNYGTYEYSTSEAMETDSVYWVLTPENAGEISSVGSTATILWDATFEGNATLTVYAENECGTGPESDGLEIAVAPSPSPELSGEAMVCDFSTEIYEAENNAGSTFNWVVTGGTITEGQGTYMITVAWDGEGSGTISVEEESINGCTGISDDFLVTIDDCTGIFDNESKSEITLYPNPANDYLTVSLASEVNSGEISVYNSTGQLILKTKFQDSKQELLINTSAFKKGVYLLKVQSGSAVLSTKMFIKN